MGALGTPTSASPLVRRATVIVPATCAIALLVTVIALASPALRARLGFDATPPAPYVAGGLIDLPAAAYTSTPRTLVVFARSNCEGCQRAKPVLTTLIAALSKYDSVRVLMVTGPQLPEDEAKLAADLGLAPASLVRMDLDALRLRSVPTTVLLNQHGEILHAVEGAPSPDDHDAFLRFAGGAARR